MAPRSLPSTAVNHSARITAQVIFVFVEEKPDRAEFLRQLAESMSLPTNFVVQIYGRKSRHSQTSVVATRIATVGFHRHSLSLIRSDGLLIFGSPSQGPYANLLRS